MKSWILTISIAVLLASSLFQINASRMMDQSVLSKPLPEPSTTQSAEIVFARGCHITVDPADNFALHVPLKNNGDMDTTKIYTTGNVHFHVEPDSCGIVNIIHK